MLIKNRLIARIEKRKSFKKYTKKITSNKIIIYLKSDLL